MKNAFLLGAIASGLVATSLWASGYGAPAHTQLSYSFTCPGGASGHANYHRKGYPATGGTLTLWVNGQDVHSHPAILPLMGTHVVQAITAACEGARAVVFLELSDPAEAKTATLTVHVDDQGHARVDWP